MKHIQRLSRSLWTPLHQAKADNLSHNLMLRADLIANVAKGLYAWKPMGNRVLNKVAAIIKKHMVGAGFEEVLLPVLQPVDLWKRSGRYDAYGKEMLRIKDRYDHELVYGPTAEECMSQLFETSQLPYVRMPAKLYNVQWKFRDEIRPRFGVMRSREFLMKDAYSFATDNAQTLRIYEEIFDAYVAIFQELGMHVQPVVADGGVIGDGLTHEFHVLSNSGENTVFYDPKWKEIDKPRLEHMEGLYSRSDEMHNSDASDLISSKAIEVGHMFVLGERYSKAMNIQVQTPNGLIYPHMACYGVGVTRLVAAIIETNHDDKGIVWPKAATPYDVHIINLHPSCEKCSARCNEVAEAVAADVLIDDLATSPGQKFANADLLGIPIQIIIGSKDVERGVVTVKKRADGEKVETADLGAWLKAQGI